MKILTIILLLILANNSYSEESEYKFNIHLASYHFNRDYDWNEKNYGFGVEKHTDSVYFGVGYFKNSYNEDSFYLSIGVDTVMFNSVEIGLFSGIASGYSQHNRGVGDFILIGGISISKEGISIELTPKFISLSLSIN